MPTHGSAGTTLEGRVEATSVDDTRQAIETPIKQSKNPLLKKKKLSLTEEQLAQTDQALAEAEERLASPLAEPKGVAAIGEQVMVEEAIATFPETAFNAMNGLVSGATVGGTIATAAAVAGATVAVATAAGGDSSPSIPTTNPVLIALAKISAYADDNTAPQPTPTDYAAAGVTGVTVSNLAAINSSLATTVITSPQADTALELQAIVNAYNTVLSEANGAMVDSTVADPTATDYAAIGANIGRAATDIENLTLLNDIAGAQAATDVDTPAEIEALADIANRIMQQAAGDTPSPALTVADLTTAGITGITAGNLSTVLTAIAAAADGGTDTLAELQALVPYEWEVTAAASTVAEGDVGSAATNFTVTRSSSSATAAIVVRTGAGTATAGTDYTAVNQTLSFAIGETSKTVAINVTGDTNAETNETVSLLLSGPTAGVVTQGQATVSILDDESSRWSVVAGLAAIEGNVLNFTVSRTGKTDSATVVVNTAGGTAGAADTNFAVQTLTFALGEMSKTLNVSATQDSDLESNETLILSITPSAGATEQATTTLTVLDDDQSNWVISTANASVSEAAGSAALVIERTGASPSATIVLTTAGGTAVPGSDYTNATQTLTFAAGEMSKTVNVAITDDSTLEPNETFSATLSGASAGNITTGNVSVEIQDNEQSVWSVDANASTASEGADNAIFTVSRTGATPAGTIVFNTAGISATSADFTGVTQTLSFADGELSKTVAVALTQDSLVESTETFQGVIQNASTGTVATGSANISILDDEQDTWLITSIDNLTSASVSEGEGTLAVLVKREGTASAAATIVVATGGGTASAGRDYTGVNQTLSFAAGETQKVVSIALTDDTSAEPNESFSVYISSASAGTLGSQTSVAVELSDNDQALWSVSADQASISEAAGSAAFTITRSGKTDNAATIVVATGGGAASAGSDYTGVNQTLSFAAGQTQQTVHVAVLQDMNPEPNESFSVYISSASAGNIETASASVSLSDDDQALWSIAANTSTAIDEGAVRASFIVARSGASNTVATIVFDVAGITAATTDFSVARQTLTFSVGEISKTVTVGIEQDTLAESTETFQAYITQPSSGTIAQGVVTQAIEDDDYTTWALSTNSGLASLSEGTGSLSASITRNGPSNETATVVIQTGGGSSAASQDYTSINQTLTFAAGEVVKTVDVLIADDVLPEADETFNISITQVSVGSITHGTLSVTLLDNEQATWSIDSAETDAAINESAGTAAFVVTRSGKIDTAATIVVNSGAGEATPNADYVPVLQTLTFAAGQTTQTVNVTLTDDSLMESAELFAMRLSQPSEGTLVRSVAYVTLVDSDQTTWSIESNATTIDEGAGTVSFVVSREGATNAAAIVVVGGAGVTASTNDFDGTAQTLSFAVGEASKVVAMSIQNDFLEESTETFIVNLLSASVGVLSSGSAQASYTIMDNDNQQWRVSTPTTQVYENAGTVSFTVSRTGVTTSAETIVFQTSNSTATNPSDYAAVLTTLSFAANESSKVVQVTLVDDAVLESTEILAGMIINQSNGTIDAATATAATTIIDDDAMIWQIQRAAESSGVSEGAGSATFLISRVGNLVDAATVMVDVYALAADPTDLALGMRTLSFAAGQASLSLSVNINEDFLREGSEAFRAAIMGTSAGTVDVSKAVADYEILDNDNITWRFVRSAIPYTVLESAGYAQYEVERVGTYDTAETIVVETSGNLASLNDYAGGAQTLSFAAGEQRKSIRIAINSDTRPEGVETFSVYLHSPSAGGLSYYSVETTALTTIVDDDQNYWAVASLSTSVQEAPGAVAGFVVTRSGDLGSAATIVVTTLPNTAAASSDGFDYTHKVETLTFAAGEASKTVSVAITNDGVLEQRESVALGISNPSAGMVAGSSTASVIIIDADQCTWEVSTPGGSTVGENAPTVSFLVSRSGGAVDAPAATVVISTGGGSASAGQDYEAVVARTLTFAAGEMAQTVQVSLINDARVETQENFALWIDSVSMGVVSSNLNTAINMVDDDETGWIVAPTTAYGPSVFEGENAAFSVYRYGANVDTTATIVFNTQSNSLAVAGQDYNLIATTLTFAAGEARKTIQTPVHVDSIEELGDTLTAWISSPSSGTLVGSSASLTLKDANFDTWDVAQHQGGIFESSEVARFYVYRTSPGNSIDNTATIEVRAYSQGVAIDGVDFVGFLRTLTFAPGETELSVDVTLLNDNVPELAENISLGLSSPSSGKINTFVSTTVISDDEMVAWTITTSSGLINEDAGKAYFTITRSGSMANTDTVVFSTSGTTESGIWSQLATAGQDYTSMGRTTFTFGPGERVKSVAVSVTDDTVMEGWHENFMGVISDASRGNITTGYATINIQDNEESGRWLLSAPGNPSENAGFIPLMVYRNEDGGAATVVLRRAISNGNSTFAATDGSDFDFTAPMTLSFAAGELRKIVNIPLIDDLVGEPTELVRFMVTDASSGLADHVLGVDIIDNDLPYFTTSVTPAMEGGAMQFTVWRNNGSDLSSTDTVVVTVGGGSATPGVDYTPMAPTTLTFAPGVRYQTLYVQTLSDSIADNGESLSFYLTDISAGATAASTTLTTTANIIEPDSGTTWSMLMPTNHTTEEGQAVPFSVRRVGDLSITATIEVYSQTGEAGSHVPLARTLTFAPGEGQKNLLLESLEDNLPEQNNLVVRIALANPSVGALIVANPSSGQATWGPSGVQYISDNDSTAFMTYQNGIGEEGYAHSNVMVRLGDTSQAQTVVIQSAGGTATSGVDYVPVLQTLSFAPGQKASSYSVQTLQDNLQEGAETINFVYTATGGNGVMYHGYTGPMTIADDADGYAGQGAVLHSVTAASANEDNNVAAFAVTRTGSLAQASTVVFTTQDATATAGVDYQAVTKTLSFASGEVAQLVLVPILADTLSEGVETLRGVLINPSRGTVSSAAIMSLLDDDQTMLNGSTASTTWDISNLGADQLYENGGGIFNVNRRGDLSTTDTVVVQTVGGVARAGTDYTPVLRTLTFAPNEATQAVLVSMTDDSFPEGGESLNVVLHSASKGWLTGNTSSLTPLEANFPRWQITSNSVPAVVEAAGHKALHYTVSYTGPPLTTVSTVELRIYSALAKAGVDYVDPGTVTLTFAPGEQSRFMSVDLLDDNVAELNESIYAVLLNPSVGWLAAAYGLGATTADSDSTLWQLTTPADVVGAYNENNGTVKVTVNRRGNFTATATVVVNTGMGTAELGVDYAGSASQTVTFAAGEQTRQVDITLINDAIAEPTKTLAFSLTDPSMGSVANATARQFVTILDDDLMRWHVGLAANNNNAVVSESAGQAAFVVSRIGSTAAATVVVSTGGGTATAGADFGAVEQQTLTFADGEVAKTVNVNLIGDATPEPNETISLQIAGVSAGSVGMATAALTVLDDDQPTWRVDALVGGAEDAGQVAFMVSRLGNIDAVSHVVVNTSGGTASAGTDYVEVRNKTLTFADGQAQQAVFVDVINDGVAEGIFETIGLTLSTVPTAGGTLKPDAVSATVTVLDDDTMSWSFTSPHTTVLEGGGGLAIAVERTGNVSSGATIVVNSKGQAATPVGGLAAVATQQTLTFAPGQIRNVAFFETVDDAIAEPGGEFISTWLSGQSAGILASTSDTLRTIVDDDLVTWAVSGGLSNAENTGFTEFLVTRNTTTSGGMALPPATISFSTMGGTAFAGQDYSSVSGLQLTFAEGEQTKVVRVPLLNDGVGETSNQTIVALLHDASVGLIGTPTASNTLLDDDLSVWSVTPNTTTAFESAGTALFVVNRANSWTGTETIVVRTAMTGAPSATTATGGLDYNNMVQTLTFGLGESNKTVSVSLTNDTSGESAETFMVALSEASSGTISTPTATATILDDDMSVWTLTAVTATASESAGQLFYRVTRSNSWADTQTVVFQTAASTATAFVDYTPVLQTLTFGIGQTEQTVAVDVFNDATGEAAETISALLSQASAGTIASTLVLTSIVDDDMATWSIAANAARSEAYGGQWFSVTRSGKIDNQQSITFSTGGAGTATAVADYTAKQEILTFAAGESTKMVRVDVSNDSLGEANETILAYISAASAGTISGGGNATATVLDDDLMQWQVAATIAASEGSLITFNVTRTGRIDVAATIQYTNGSGTAMPGSDFVSATMGVLTFAAGESLKVVTLSSTQDTLAELNETLNLVLFNPSLGSVQTPSITNAINTDELQHASFALTALNAGSLESGGKALFQVARTVNFDTTETVVYGTTAGSSGTSGTVGTDYTSASGTLTFGAGEVNKTIAVDLLTDGAADGAKTFDMRIVSSADAGTAQVTYTINDSDATASNPTWALAAVNAGAAEDMGVAVFSVTRTVNLAATHTVVINTTAGTATDASDYTGVVNQTLTFAPGEGVKHVTVPLLSDASVESGETFTVSAAVSSGVAPANVTYTIGDSDTALAVPTWAVAAVTPTSTTLEDAGMAVFSVTRSVNLAGTDTIVVNTGGGTATAGTDYTGVSNLTLTFAPGESVKHVNVPLLSDLDVDAGETFQVTLSGPSAGTAPAANTFTIGDSDAAVAAPSWAIVAAAAGTNVAESAGRVLFQVTRSTNLRDTHTVEYLTNMVGTATSGTDFTPLTAQTLTFAPGETVKTVAVQITDDSVVELNAETVGLALQNASAGSTSAAATAIITDNDILNTGSGNDTIVLNSATGFGGNAVGVLVNAEDGNDSITLGTVANSWAKIDAGLGDDTVNLATGATGSDMFTSGAQILGGDGVDTLNFVGTGTTLNLRTLTTPDVAQGFEVVNLTGTGNNTLVVGLQDVLDLTGDNLVANILRIDGNAGDALQIAGAGITGLTGIFAPTFTTVTAGGTITDVTGSTQNVVTSAAGNVNANDVTFNGHTYDVYQFNTSSGLATLLVDVTMTTTFIA